MGLLGGKKPPPADPVALAQAQRSREEQEVSAAFRKGITALRDFIAPSSIEYASTHFQLGTKYARTYYVYGYPRSLTTGWLSSLVNLDEVIDLSHLYLSCRKPSGTGKSAQKSRSAWRLRSMLDAEKGRVRDPGTQSAIQDAEEMRDKLQVGEERFFRFGMYFTLYAGSMDELEFVSP